MKALLLSAGYGYRLKPYTNTLPKCLLPICGKPLLFHWLDLLEKEKISEVLINTHYLSENIKQAITSRTNNIKIKITYEKELLGSAGTIFFNRDFFENEENFLLLYSDNLTNVPLTSLINFHYKKNSTFTTYVYETNNPTEKGIFEIDEKTGNVIGFEEKPQNPKSNYANAGLGVLNKKIFNYSTSETPLDFAKSIMPLIISETNVLKTNDLIIDIGTNNDYMLAQDLWAKIK